MTAVAPVDICNLSLDLLRSKERVTSIEVPESEVDALAARWYDMTRRSVLRGFPWNFARKRAALSLDVLSPDFGYPNAYNLPSDYLELVFVGENYDEDYEIDYSIEGNQLLIDAGGATSINVCYVSDFTTVVRFDPIFVDLMTAELALRMSNSLTGVNKSMKEIIAWRDRLETKARAKNGHENPPRSRYRSPLLNARRRAETFTSSDGVHLFS
jgi:hypothetical protein